MIMNLLEQRIKEQIKNLEVLAFFNDTHPLELPSALVSIYSGMDKPHLTIHCGSAPNEHGRNKMLSAIGDAYGREGWKKHESAYSRNSFSWKREIEGVLVEIESAEPIPERQQNIPVSPSAFPILIKDEEE